VKPVEGRWMPVALIVHKPLLALREKSLKSL
jgi:hypothetical protein